MNGIDLFFITQDETFQEYSFTLENSTFVPSTGDHIQLANFKDLLKCHHVERDDNEAESFKRIFDTDWIIGRKWWTMHHETKRVTVEIDLHNGENPVVADNDFLGNMTMEAFKKNVFL